MTDAELESRDDLTAAVRLLIGEVKELNEKLSYYAPRDEVKRDGRNRAWKFFGFAVIVILLAQALSMTTISYCFLDANASRKSACGVIPGYNEAIEQNEIRLARFGLLLSTIEKNEKEIELINARLEKLESEKG